MDRSSGLRKYSCNAYRDWEALKPQRLNIFGRGSYCKEIKWLELSASRVPKMGDSRCLPGANPLDCLQRKCSRARRRPAASSGTLARPFGKSFSSSGFACSSCRRKRQPGRPSQSWKLRNWAAARHSLILKRTWLVECCWSSKIILIKIQANMSYGLRTLVGP